MVRGSSEAPPGRLWIVVMLLWLSACAHGVAGPALTEPPTSTRVEQPAGTPLMTATQPSPTVTPAAATAQPSIEPTPVVVVLTHYPLLEVSATRPVSATPTPNRPTFQIQDSTNVMAVGSFLWHPNDSRGTERLDILVGPSSWSADGRQLVGRSREYQTLAILTLETGELMPLANVSPQAHGASWSPNGRYLFYLVDTHDNEEKWFQHLMIYDLETQTEQALGEPLDPTMRVALIGWSPDSRRVAHTLWVEAAGGELVTALETIDIYTAEVTRYVGAPSIGFFEGSWSPTQDQILLLAVCRREMVEHQSPHAKLGHSHPSFD